METLTQICSNKIKALRSAYVSEQELRCRNCTNYEQECYKPLSSEVTTRFGANAYVLMREKK